MKFFCRSIAGIFCVSILAVAFCARAADPAPAEPKPTVAPPASWVTPRTFNRNSPENAVDATTDQRWLLNERQVNPAENESFVHLVWQIKTVAGVQNGANLSIDFNPGYQSLTLHWVRIWRGTQSLDRLDINKIKIVQPERELDQFVLNGKHSAVLVLEDVRIGDIIDYSYSLKGANPVFGGRFFSSVRVQMEQPVEHLLTRIVWPSGRRLYAKTHGCSIQPAMVKKPGAVDYTWDLERVPGFPNEDSLPAWCDPEPWVQVTEFASWAEVNQWAMSLFQNAGALSPELSKKIAEWKLITDRPQQVLTVLRFVQDEVRYFGIEIGENAMKPADPSVVFSRRFGDCKDKALLFVSILRVLGIEAYPVLVNTDSGHVLDNWRPSPGIFDHCIAVVRCGGQTNWLDPTMCYQRGPLTAHYLPNYEHGLVVSAQTTGLTPIPHAAGLPRTATTEYFRLGPRKEGATLKVVTTAEGRDADDLRSLLATAKPSDIEKSHVHVYSSLYPGITTSAPMAIVDDEQQNRIQTTESYTIPNVWGQPDKNRKLRCEFYPYAIGAFLKKPVDTARKLPLGISFPEHLVLRTEVTLPEPWPSDTDRKEFSDAGFYFRKDLRCAGNRVVVEYEYKSLADAIAPEQVPQYLKRLDTTSQSLGYALSWR